MKNLDLLKKIGLPVSYDQKKEILNNTHPYPAFGYQTPSYGYASKSTYSSVEKNTVPIFRFQKPMPSGIINYFILTIILLIAPLLLTKIKKNKLHV